MHCPLLGSDGSKPVALPFADVHWSTTCDVPRVTGVCTQYQHSYRIASLVHNACVCPHKQILNFSNSHRCHKNMGLVRRQHSFIPCCPREKSNAIHSVYKAHNHLLIYYAHNHLITCDWLYLPAMQYAAFT